MFSVANGSSSCIQTQENENEILTTEESDGPCPFAEQPDNIATDSDSDDPNSDDESLTALELLNSYCLKVKEEAMVSAKTMSTIEQVTLSLMKATTTHCERQVHRVLRRYGIDPSSMPELDDAFESGHWDHSSPELNWNMSMKNFYPDVQPQQILLGKRRQWKRLPNKKSKIVEYPERFYYISLLASTEIQLNNKRILDMVADPQINQDGGLLTDFIDGSFMDEHELFSIDSRSLKIILYHDLQITNERTSRKHKLAMFYYQLANMYTEYRSKLKSIAHFQYI